MCIPDNSSAQKKGKGVGNIYSRKGKVQRIHVNVVVTIKLHKPCCN